MCECVFLGGANSNKESSFRHVLTYIQYKKKKVRTKERR